jgi:hypothetical protein
LKSRDSVAYIHILYAIYILQNCAGGGPSKDYNRRVMEGVQLTLEQRAAGAQQVGRRGGWQRWTGEGVAALEKGARASATVRCVMRVPYWYK